MHDTDSSTKQNNLTRGELAETLANKLGYSQSNCSLIVDSSLDNMKHRGTWTSLDPEQFQSGSLCFMRLADVSTTTTTTNYYYYYYYYYY